MWVLYFKTVPTNTSVLFYTLIKMFILNVLEIVCGRYFGIFIDYFLLLTLTTIYEGSRAIFETIMFAPS